MSVPFHSITHISHTPRLRAHFLLSFARTRHSQTRSCSTLLRGRASKAGEHVAGDCASETGLPGVETSPRPPPRISLRFQIKRFFCQHSITAGQKRQTAEEGRQEHSARHRGGESR